MGDDDPDRPAPGDAAGRSVAGEIRRRRQEAGLSQHQLASMVAFSREYVSRAERPSRGLPSENLVAAVDVALDAGGALVELRRETAAAGCRHRENLTRRRMLGAAPQQTVGEHMSTALVAEEATSGSAALLAEVVASQVDPLTLDEIEERVEALAVGYFRTDPDLFGRAVLLLRARVVELMAVGSSLRQRRRMYAALAALTGMLAESAFASGTSTDVHCVAALALAEEAGHSALAGWVRGTQAQIALHTGAPVAAVRFARAGGSAPRGSAAAVRAATYLARASARLGDRSTTWVAWRSAEHAWEDLDTALTESVFSLSADYLSYCELTMLAWLGEAGPAARLVDRDHVCGAPLVGRAIGQIDVALVRVLGGEVEEAVRLGNRALDIGGSRMTPPLRDRCGDLVAALAPYDVAAVQEFRRRCVWISG